MKISEVPGTQNSGYGWELLGSEADQVLEKSSSPVSLSTVALG